MDPKCPELFDAIVGLEIDLELKIDTGLEGRHLDRDEPNCQ